MPEKTQFDWKTLKRLLSYMRQYRSTMILVTVCILLSAVASAASSMFLRTLIDDYIVPLVGQSQPVFTGLIRALLTIGGVYLVGILATWIYNRAMVTIAQGTLKTIRDEMFEKMQYLPIRYFDSHTNGDTMSLYTNDTDTLRQLIAQSMSQFISSIFTIVAVFFCMLYISVWLTLVVLVSLFFILKAVELVVKKTGKYFAAQQMTLAELDGYVEEMIGGQKVIKVFCHEEEAKAEFRKKNQAWQRNSAKANGHANAMMPMMNALGYFQYVIVAILGAYMAISGVMNLGLTGTDTMTLGMIASFLTLSRSFTGPIAQISNQFNSIVTALAGASRIFRFMDEAPETDDGYVTLVNAKEQDGALTECPEHTGLWAWKHPHGDGTVTYVPLEGRMVFDHVDFGYDPAHPVLRDFSADIPAGSMVAVVGPTGAGKTTLVSLLLRFYTPQKGSITIDGLPIQQYTRDGLRRRLAIVLQDGWLCGGTIAENIAYGVPGATRAQIEAAAKAACIHSFLSSLPDGYDTALTDSGAGLSKGQRQLLALARCFLSNADIVILDEATSDVDPETEEQISAALERLRRGRTCFLIAHRLATVRTADRILVLQDGRIAEQGTHQQLLDAGGIYRVLYDAQFS